VMLAELLFFNLPQSLGRFIYVSATL